MQTINAEDTPPRLTRRQVAEFLQAKGFPVALKTLHNICSRKEGPPPIALWGRRPLYDPSTVLLWAEARLRPVREPEAA